MHFQSMVLPSITQSNGRKSKWGDFSQKTKYFISEKNIPFLIILDGALSSLSSQFFFGCHPLFHSGIYHVTCIWPVSKSSSYTINPLPCMFYLSPALCQSLALFLSLSSGHVSLWGLTAMLQMQPLLEPVWNRTSKPKVKNSEITNCGTLQQWRVYAATPFTRAGSYLAEFF